MHSMRGMAQRTSECPRHGIPRRALGVTCGRISAELGNCRCRLSYQEAGYNIVCTTLFHSHITVVCTLLEELSGYVIFRFSSVC